MESADALSCCCLSKTLAATLALCYLAPDIAATKASATPWFAASSAPGAGTALLLLGLGLEDAARGGAGPTEARRTVVAMLEPRPVVVANAARKGYRAVGTMLGSRTVAMLPAIERFLTVDAML